VIYEVELLHFVQRLDVDGQGKIFKQVEIKADKYDHQVPADLDDVDFTV